LSLTFSKAIFLGNGLIAIIAGLVANTLAGTFNFGPVSPFDAAACVLAVGMAVILATWAENYGDQTEGKSIIDQFTKAAAAIASGKLRGCSKCSSEFFLKVFFPLVSIVYLFISLLSLNLSCALNCLTFFSCIWRDCYKCEDFDLICACCDTDEKIALLGAIQSLFEGSMYTFVFLWTPALSHYDQMIPFGFIFATFMLASMLGSSLASRLMSRSNLRVESYMQVVFAVASGSLCLPVIIQVRHLTCTLKTAFVFTNPKIFGFV
jgi:hypothetical protein